MARRFRIGRSESQRQYRDRLAKYEAYKAKTLDPLSFKEWNAPYRKNKFLRREYRIYKAMFKERKKSSTFGFRKTDEGGEIKPYDFDEFKENYLVERNTLSKEVKMGERKRIGSVLTELINDQAYEISSRKAAAIAKYLISEERNFLIQKKIIVPESIMDESGEMKDYIKMKRLTLLIRQGDFVREDIGLWDEIKERYRWLIGEGMTSQEAKEQIGITYFNSPK